MHPEQASTLDAFGVLLNQLARFSVPVFVFLSGYGLAIKFKDGGSFVESARQFYVNRMARIGVPFLVWTLGNLIFRKRMWIFGGKGLLGNIGSNFLVFTDSVWQYGADYHLYFFTIVLWCYLFFPVLIRLRSLWLLGVLLVIQLSYQAPAYLIWKALGIHLPSIPSSFFFEWLFYFYAAILLARSDAERQQMEGGMSVEEAPGRPLWMLPFLLLFPAFGLVYTEYLFNNNGQDTGNFDHFHRWTIWIYAMTMVWLFRRADFDLVQWLGERPHLGRLIATLTGLSFTVYLIHTWILRGIDAIVPWYLPKLLILIPVSFTAAAILDRLLRQRDRRPVYLLRLILGLPA